MAILMLTHSYKFRISLQGIADPLKMELLIQELWGSESALLSRTKHRAKTLFLSNKDTELQEKIPQKTLSLVAIAGSNTKNGNNPW